DRALASAALTALPREASNIEQVKKILSNPSTHPLVRQQAALYFADLAPDPRLGEILGQLLVEDNTVTDHLRTAIGIAAIRHPEGFVRYLIETNADPETVSLRRYVNQALQGPLSAGLQIYAEASSSRLSTLMKSAAASV